MQRSTNLGTKTPESLICFTTKEKKIHSFLKNYKPGEK